MSSEGVDVLLPGKGWSAGRQFVPRQVCQSCGALFYAPPIQLRRGGGKFCSVKCYGLSQRGERNHHFKPKVVISCATCGRQFEEYPSKADRSRYCSVPCRFAGQRVALQPCEQCGNPRPRTNGQFCSKACVGLASRRRIMRSCEQCGKDFEILPSTVANGFGRFCTMRCYAKWQGPNGSRYSRTRGGKRDDLGGQYFRSGWEANYARYLNWLVGQGQINSWTYEAETFEFPVKRGSRFYTPDFRVVENDGRVVFHEVKGWMDQRSITKLRRMARYHPKVELLVIGQPEYRELVKKVAALVPGWAA